MLRKYVIATAWMYAATNCLAQQVESNLTSATQTNLSTELINNESTGACTAPQTDRIVKEIKDKYQSKIDSARSHIQEVAQGIQNDAPQGDGVGAAVGIDFHFTDIRSDLYFDLPSVTMENTKVALDLPETTMKTQTWSWDSPVIVMRQQCVQGIPETVWYWNCSGIPPKDCPGVTVRAGKPICTDIPETTMQRQQIKLDIPEVTMRRQDWVIPVPRITMEKTHIAFDYPALVVDKISTKTEELKQRGDDLNKESESIFSSISGEMKAEIGKATTTQLDEQFNCQKKLLSKKIRSAYNDLTTLQKAAKSSLDSAKSQGASQQVISTLEESFTKISAAKKNLLIQYADSRRTLEKKKSDAIASAFPDSTKVAQKN